MRQVCRDSRPTWEDLAVREPRLVALRADVERVRVGIDETFCANAAWYGYGGRLGLKPRLVRLVGWGAQSRDPVLRSCEAYDVAYETLYELLPDCRNCGCVNWSAA